MKNKRIVAANSLEENSVPKESEEEMLGFERLLIDAGQSKKTANELLKWYTTSN